MRPGETSSSENPVGTRPPSSSAAGEAPARRPYSTVSALDAALTDCRACPRLVQWRELVAHTKRAAFRDETYWGRPVPGFGPDDTRMLIVGLAPPAHGGNRTGRMFTGARSGDVLFAALHAVGLATRPVARHAEDDMRLLGVRMTAPVHCAPPENKPTVTERDRCRGWLEDRKSTRLNSSHVKISYAVFCLKKKKKKEIAHHGSKDTPITLQSIRACIG